MGQLNSKYDTVDYHDGSVQPLSVPPLKMDVDCSRPIVPPQSRQSVKRQFDLMEGWTTLDAEYGIFFATRKRRLAELSTQRADAIPTISVKGTAADEATASESVRLGDVSFAPKRRRLILAPCAVKIANEAFQHPSIQEEEACPDKKVKLDLLCPALADSTTATSDVDTQEQEPSMKEQEFDTPATLSKASTAFEEISDDEGYYTGSTMSPTSTTGIEAGADDELLKTLAHFQRRVPALGLPDESDLDQQEDGISEARIRLQERSAQRSRHLRKQAQNRRHDPPPPTPPASTSDHEFSPDPEPEVPSTLSSFRATLDSIGVRLTPLPGQSLLSDTVLGGLGDTKSYCGTLSDSHPHSKADTLPATKARSPHHTQARTSELPLGYARAFARPRSLQRTSKYQTYTQSRQQKYQNGLHPASRQAAEQWRTQDRHSEQTTVRDTCRHSAAAEQRLLAVQYGQSKIVFEPSDMSAELNYERVSPEAVSIPLNDGDRSGPLNLETKSSSTRDNPTSTLEALLGRQEEQARRQKEIPLGERFDIDISSPEAYRAERKRLQEIQADLKLVRETYIVMAQLRHFRNFEGIELKWCASARTFTTNVLENGTKGGKGLAVAARDGFKRRLETEYGNLAAPVENVKLRYENLLGTSFTPRLEEVSLKVTSSLAGLETDLEAQKEKNKKAKEERREEQRREREEKRRVQFAEVVQEIDEHGTARNVNGPGSATAQKKKKPKPKKVRKKTSEETIYDLRQELAAITGQLDAPEIAAQDESNAAQHDSESDVSEEDADGNDFLVGGFKAPSTSAFMAAPTSDGHGQNGELVIEDHQDMEEVTALEEARQREVASQPRISGQVYDEKLLCQNKLAAIERQEVANATVFGPQFDDVEDEEPSDAEIVEAGAESGSEDDDDDDVGGGGGAFQYSLSGIFHGLEDLYVAGDEYIFGKYLQRKNAEQKLLHIISQLSRRYATQHCGEGELRSYFGPDGIRGQQLILGDRGDFMAQMTIAKKLVNISKKQAWAARKMNVDNIKTTWYVEWEKHVETTIKRPSSEKIKDTSAADGDGDDAEDDLFGTPPPEVPTVESSTKVEKPAMHEIEMFNNVLQANIRAKQLFMEWFARFAPASERQSLASGGYTGQLRLREDELQREIDEASEGVGVGPWEKELKWPTREVVEDDEHGAERWLYDEAVGERMRVVVREMKVKGPRN
ncbi:uncharacterized protein HMPREF1541_05827 [Cyphellophora europaea CBS 101466]|uniref:Uncharacterized protein n=1 Tax=Cyphellophora europaea (strain CBS 101466) TaxID=1220924 RepID=W2RSV5_CYPE1|nr:uncharacterized protein HMPREF1541_05827 [Cyphellophora europaea CBS 101466]ETN39601.1 hypothetical protein HMPREF1541_05827 [Cyphellophora europaea CBS 101466]